MILRRVEIVLILCNKYYGQNKNEIIRSFALASWPIQHHINPALSRLTYQEAYKRFTLKSGIMGTVQGSFSIFLVWSIRDLSNIQWKHLVVFNKPQSL